MRKVFFIFFLFLLTLPVVWPFFQKGYFKTHDIIYLTRIYTASKALSDGQFPLRWVSDFRYGEPLFNYYAPLPYYFGALIHFAGFNFIATSKILFILITFFSAIFMYLLAREWWGNWGGVISAVLYLYAPYRALDLYVRGTLSEVFAFVWFPLIFWVYLKFSQTLAKNYFLLGAFSVAFLILTHNIMSFVFLPFFLTYLLFLVFTNKDKPLTLPFFFSLLAGLGLSATYWLPALFEQNFVQTQRTILSLDNFVNQFVKWKEFIQPAWNGFNITHELGILQLTCWLVALLTFLILRQRKKNPSILIFSSILLLVSLWLQTKESLQLWLFLPLAQFIQFPWRLGGMSIFFLSFLGGSFVLLIKGSKKQTFLSLFVILLTISTQSYFFRPQNRMPEATDKDFILLEEAYLPKEYLPLWVKEEPSQKLFSPTTLKNYQPLQTEKIIKQSNFYSFTAKLEKPEEIVLPIYFFPGWKASDNKEKIEVRKAPKTGLIILSLAPGEHEIYLKFTDTPLRRMANIVSFFSLILTTLLVFGGLRKNHRLNSKILTEPTTH